MIARNFPGKPKSGWKTVPLCELGQLYCGQSPPSNKVNIDGVGTLYVTGPEQWDGHKIRQDKWTTDPKRVVPKGSIFITVKGAGVGKIFPGIDCAIGRDIYAFKPNAGLSVKFIEHAVRFTVQDVLRHAVGDIPGISKSHILEHEIALPEPEEQVNIVAEIEKQFSRLDEAVAFLKRTKANLKRYKAAVLKAAVKGALVPIKNRQTTKIGEVADLVTKGSSPNWQGFTYADSGVVFVRSQNVGWGNLDLSDVAHLPPAFNEKERKSVLRTGDVLLNIVGASIGRAAVATPEIEGGNVNQAVAVIRLNKERMLPKYLMLNLLSPGTQAVIHAEKVDVARANVSLSDIKDFSVLFPSLAEQGTMVAEVERRLSVIEELESAVNANLIRADRLRQSILSQAFAGKLVCVNANRGGQGSTDIESARAYNRHAQ